MQDEQIDNGAVRARWNFDTHTYTAYDENGQVVEERPFTEAENVYAAARLAIQREDDTRNRHDTNRAALRDRLGPALDANTTFLNLATPTNAQVAAQVKTLTRENQALIRMVADFLDTTD